MEGSGGLGGGDPWGTLWGTLIWSSVLRLHLLHSVKHLTNILGEPINFQIQILNALNNEFSHKEQVGVLEENIFHGLERFWKNIHISSVTLGLNGKLR